MSGTQLAVASGSSRSCGTNRSRPHSSAMSNSLRISVSGMRRDFIVRQASSSPATASAST